jgi:hypothetical protein
MGNQVANFDECNVQPRQECLPQAPHGGGTFASVVGQEYSNAEMPRGTGHGRPTQLNRSLPEIRPRPDRRGSSVMMDSGAGVGGLEEEGGASSSTADSRDSDVEEEDYVEEECHVGVARASQPAQSRSLSFGPSQTLGFRDSASQRPQAMKRIRTYFDLELGEGPSSSSGTRERKRHTFSSGATYDGEWDRGVRDGFGKQTWPDGTEFVGEWYRGLAGGHGRLILGDQGDSFVGQFVSGRAHGWGTFVFKHGSSMYRGEFKNDIRHGFGVESWADGSCYEGEFRLGKKHGFGQNKWPDGTTYSGSWNANELVGAGCFKVKDGSCYQGQWAASSPHGVGVYRWADGRVYEGGYRHDKKHGFGSYQEAGQEPLLGYWMKGELLP